MHRKIYLTAEGWLSALAESAEYASFTAFDGGGDSLELVTIEEVSMLIEQMGILNLSVNISKEAEAMKYPLQSDEYDVDIFNDNFRELDGSISENFETMSNNMAKKADITDLEEEASDIRDYVDEVKEELDTKINAKAPSSHTHTLTGGSVTGILPVSKGGTGQSSVDTAPTSGSSRMVTSGGVYTALNKVKKVFAIGRDFNTFEDCQNYIEENNLYGCTVYLRTAHIPSTGITVTDGRISVLDFCLSNLGYNTNVNSWESTTTAMITAERCTIQNLLLDYKSKSDAYLYMDLGVDVALENVVINNSSDISSGLTGGNSIIKVSTAFPNVSISNCYLQNVDIKVTDTGALNPVNSYIKVCNSVINKLTINVGTRSFANNPIICVINNVFGEEPSVTASSAAGKKIIENNVIVQ